MTYYYKIQDGDKTIGFLENDEEILDEGFIEISKDEFEELNK